MMDPRTRQSLLHLAQFTGGLGLVGGGLGAIGGALTSPGERMYGAARGAMTGVGTGLASGVGILGGSYGVDKLPFSLQSQGGGSALMAAVTAAPAIAAYELLRRRQPERSEEKQAFNPIESYENLKSHPLGATAHMIGSILPATGSVVSGADMVQNLYRGNLASAGLNAVGVAAGLVPGGGSLVKALNRGGRLGRTAARAAPYLSHLAPAVEPHFGHMIGSMAAPVVAGAYDQSQQMNRPIYQKQQKEQEQMMSEFNQWRQHKQTLQQLAAQSGGEKAGAAPTYVDMNRDAWNVTKKMTPYVTAASLGAHMLPSLYQEDMGGTARGAAVGGGATLGGLGGIMAGTSGGMALANAIANKYPRLDPKVVANVGAIMGGTFGGLIGHTAGRKGMQALVEPEEQQQRRYKYGSDQSILALRRALEIEKQAVGAREQKHQKGQQKKQVEQLISAGFDPSNPGKAIDAMNKARRRGGATPAEPKLVEAPPAVAGPPAVEAGPVAEAVGLKPRRVFNEVPGELNSSGAFVAAAERPFPRVSKGSVPTGLEGGLPPLAETIDAPMLPPPAATSHSPATAEAMPGMFARMKTHPMYQGASRFAASPKGKLAIAGALAAAGAGAYWAGRGKRKVEDNTAEQEMAQTA